MDVALIKCFSCCFRYVYTIACYLTGVFMFATIVGKLTRYWVNDARSDFL